MKVEEIVLDRILNAMKNGIIPWRKPWSSKLPCNFVTKRRYNGINLFLLSLSPYSSPYWLTFKQAKEKGLNVLKGERGSPIVFWSIKDYTDKNGDVKTIPFLRYYTVFNLQQTDSDFQEENQIEFNPVEKAEKFQSDFFQAQGVELTDGMKACYIPSLDRIQMPKKESFFSVEGYYSTLFHEMAHATGHKGRLNRLVPASFGSDPYVKEELIAELASAFACAENGIDNTLQNSAAYLQGWMKKLKEDPKLLIQASGKAAKAFKFMAGEVEEVEEVES